MSNNVDLYIQELETTKVEIKNAIIAKGVTPEGGLSSYADAINSIESSTFETETLSVELSENGTYNYTPTVDGYSSVEVTVDVPEPIIENESLSVELTENGTYNYTPTKDGYSSVEVVVDVAGSGGDGKPKIYNGFKLLSTDTSLSTTQRLTTKLQEVDFTQYDWSQVYDLSEFFGGFRKDSAYNAYAFKDSDFDNFRAGYNGQMVSCKNMFNTAPGASSNYTLKEIPDFSMFTDKLVNMSGAFGSSELRSADNITKWNTSNVVDMSSMFYGCSNLTSVPLFDTSNVVDMSSMFYGCSNLTSVPLFDTSNVVDMSSMFNGCRALSSVPELDYSNVTNITRLFANTVIKEIPDLDISCIDNFGGPSTSWLYNVSVTSIGVLQCGKISDPRYLFGSSSNNKITYFGGIIDLGKRPIIIASYFNSNYFMNYAPNLTYESVMNVINGLYDRASAGYSVVNLKLHANHLAMLSEDDIAIATNKGWTLS